MLQVEIVTGLILTFIVNRHSLFADQFNTIAANKPNFKDHDHVDIENEKRDIIKGPSFIPNIDARTADSDIAYENHEVSEEGSRRLYIGTPFDPTITKYNKPRHNIEDSIETLMKDSSDTWAPSNTNIIKGISHLLHHKKSHGIVDERATKKDSFSTRKHEYTDDLPNKVIKALYDWKVDDGKEYTKSKIVSNTSSDSSDSSDSTKATKHSSPKSEIHQPVENSNSETYKPFLTEDGFSVDELAEAEPVIPAHRMTPNLESKISSVAKKRKKINVLVNVNINEAPGRRSKVGNSHHLDSSFFTLSTETDSPQKIHFSHSHHRGRELKLHHKPVETRAFKKTLREDSGSGEGSGSGAVDAKPSVAEVYSKANTAVKANTNTLSGNIQEDAIIHEDHDSIGNKAKYGNVDNKSKDDNSELKLRDNKENQYHYDSYHGEKNEDDDNESSGSGHTLTNEGHAKDITTKELNHKILYANGEGKNESDANIKPINKEYENKERHDKSVNKENENQNVAKTTEAKEGVEADVLDTTTIGGIDAEQRDGETSNVEHNEYIDSIKDQSDKSKSLASNLTNPVTQNDEAVNSKKEKQEEVANTDGTDNMKKKMGPEDKYETLEEVREKFKKWESNIIKSPSETTAGDENNKSSATLEESNNSSPKTDKNNNSETQISGTKPKTFGDESNEEKNDKNVLFTEKKVNEMMNNKPSGDFVTEKGGEEKTQEKVEKEKQPDDFVKELIGISSKEIHLQKANTNEKANEDTKKEKDTLSEGTKASASFDKLKGENGKEEEKSLFSKFKTPYAGEDKFNMEEVSKKNKEHHDIPDADMKIKESPEKVNLKSEDISNLNASNVPGVAEQTSTPAEKLSETSTSSLDDKPLSQETSTEEKQASNTEGKIVISATTAEEKPMKQASNVEEKPMKGTAKVDVNKQSATEEKHAKETSTVGNKQMKQTSASEEKPSRQSKENEFTQDEDKSLKKTTMEESRDSTEFTIDQDKSLTNPLIAKEANEFSNEQEKSFASAIEKIKAQEEKLKGKEISNEIQEIKFSKNADVNNEMDEEKFNKDNNDDIVTSATTNTKKHTSSIESKKPSEKNLKQLKLYKHQILSEVEKIDDLMNEYQKDGHSTKELTEAKEVLENDLKLVKELERNTKKKSSLKKEKEKGKQIMPSSAYLSTFSDENKDEVTHRDKSTMDSKSLAKSLEKEAEKSEKQLESLIPSYEYYFHTESKSTSKHPKKQSLEEIHKLLKAEIKRLKQKKNGKADNQLKNIRKLVQQHLKKLISTGDIDKTAFHSLAPEIKQLGELLKERIKSLKKKKIARKIKVKKFKENILTQNIKAGSKTTNDLYDQLMEAQVSFNESRGGKFGGKLHHHLEGDHKLGTVERLDPPLDSVKGVDSPDKLYPAHSVANPIGQESSPSSDNKATHEDKLPLNETMLLSAIGDSPKSTAGASVDPAQSINIKTLLKTLNEKLGSVYQRAKDVHDARFENNASTQESPEVPSHQEQQLVHQDPQHQKARSHQYDAEISGIAPGSTQHYTAQKPMTGAHMSAASVPTPNILPGGEQQQNVEAVITPPVIDSAVTLTSPISPSTDAQQAMATASNNAVTAETNTAPIEESYQPNLPIPMQSQISPAAAESKNDLPMVPEEPEFEEDTTEALASLEPINTLVETLEKDITELWSYKDLYPNAESLGLDNEKVHNTYANLGSLSGLSLRRALNRALRGEDVGIGVVGGSISKGGPFSEKGLEYVLRSYFYAIEDYWNKVIRPVTGSSMIVRDVSLGGISTDYYSFCIRNHLPDDKLTNIVLWELSANDMRRYDDSLKPKPQPLEQFTRNILTYRAKPSLIFVNFFALFDWDPDLRANCRNFEDEGEDDVAKYYKITSLSWRNMVCPLLKSETSPIFTRNNLFAEDHFHPSILGHAQMSYIIIDYIRTEFLKNLVKMRPFFIGDAVEKLQIPRSVYMPRPMFKETFLWKPLCYTYMLVDNRLPNNTMPLHEENESDFKYTVVRGFKIRSDKIAGMETKLKDQFIRYKLQIPRHEDGGLAPFKQLGIMSFTDDRYAEIQFDSQHPTRLEAKKRFLEGTVVKTVAENIEPGDHTLTVRSGDSGFLICALVLG